ncbi:hypothetical protein BDQ12DRAFT_678285 [Crucibulum laeve]|uniref:Uncharacterized protein n=1 Tax=Crucibulum laeve TaxID=68775 RepID=A0A5C3M865_9AGAR|nr:hypothetical protein BDQ12DRAFT_678285 [Crucibulum laeve]
MRAVKTTPNMLASAPATPTSPSFLAFSEFTLLSTVFGPVMFLPLFSSQCSMLSLHDHI